MKRMGSRFSWSNPGDLRLILKLALDQRGLCGICGNPIVLTVEDLTGISKHIHIDHVVPVSLGGSDDLVSNLQITHAGCNLKARDFPKDKRSFGGKWRKVKLDDPALDAMVESGKVVVINLNEESSVSIANGHPQTDVVGR